MVSVMVAFRDVYKNLQGGGEIPLSPQISLRFYVELLPYLHWKVIIELVAGKLTYIQLNKYFLSHFYEKKISKLNARL